MSNDFASFTKTLMMGVKLMKKRYKKYIKSKGDCKDVTKKK